MPTKMDNIFKDFLSSVDDYGLTLNNKDALTLSEELFGYYRYARRKFVKCAKDLGTSFESYYDIPEGSEMEINSELTYEEYDIILSLMLVAYLRPIINSNKVLRQALTDKDFNLTSQANHLNQLSIWYRRLKAESDKLMTQYTYRQRMGD